MVIDELDLLVGDLVDRARPADDCSVSVVPASILTSTDRTATARRRGRIRRGRPSGGDGTRAVLGYLGRADANGPR
ncbi:hypothetical protein [Nocardia amikacinitolerans]|uniref:hypothetical protein n=1 Tax=Nocardia amikacinitolerans TaxID=756689 RepID=UPI000BE2E8ED|nr:hypothetical protein [Nocardia amikacinitolerans]